MARARTPRRAWIDEGLRALARGGPQAVRIESLAQSLGVTKGGFYGYFDNRSALLEEMLDAFEHEGVDAIIELVEAPGGDARDKLMALFALGTGDAVPELFAVELAIREWARRDAAVAERLHRIDNRRMEYMRSLFRVFCPAEDEVELRATLLGALYLANHLSSIDHGPRTRADVLHLALTRLLA
jgi:AcrR family transcriptional regulator